MPSPPAGPRRILPTRPGLIAGPFVAGVAAVLLLATGLGQAITMSWMGTGIVLGVLLSGVAVGTALLRGQADPAGTAHQAAGGGSSGGDPLAHIHAVEAQGRRHQRTCMNCGAQMKASARECPSCAHMQVFTCKGCRTEVRLEWKNCPECGRALT